MLLGVLRGATRAQAGLQADSVQTSEIFGGGAILLGGVAAAALMKRRAA